jgi:ribonuclease P protein component
MSRQYTFSKEERLCSKKAIDRLFEDGFSFFSHPFTVVWQPYQASSSLPARTGISVPKKNFKKAVDRNRIKRVTREAWRHQKKTLYNILEQHNMRIVIMLIYNGRELPSPDEMNKNIKKLINRLAVHLNSAEGKPAL